MIPRDRPGLALCSGLGGALVGLLRRASAEKGDGLAGGGGSLVDRLRALASTSPLGFRPVLAAGVLTGAGGRAGVWAEREAVTEGASYSTLEEELRSRIPAPSNLEFVSVVELLPDFAAESFALISSDLGLPYMLAV